jgi:RNA recognition motif-containing protein
MLSVGNLSPETTAEDLESLFGQMARVVSVRTVGGSTGCGFVEVEAGVGVSEVISRMGVTEIDGRSLDVLETPSTGTPESARPSTSGPERL